MNAIETTYWVLAGAAALVIAGIGSSLIARRFGAPLLLVFLVIGMFAGSDGPGGIAFEDYSITYRVGSLALAVILFDGGLRTRIAHMRGVLMPTMLLATIGVVVTAVLTGLIAAPLLGLELPSAILLGSVCASTDAAAVFFLLRAGGLQLRQRVGATLEIESSANDPVAVLLTTMLATYLAHPVAVTPGALVLELALQFGVGGAIGWFGGLAIVQALRRLPLAGALAALFMVSSAVLLFGLAGTLHGSAFLAVYLAGLAVGNRHVPGFVGLLSVLDAATWLCQIAMFLVLGLLVTPHALLAGVLPALAIAAFLMFVGRPLAVAICLAPFHYGKREIAFVAWVGLRGAVGIFLASIPMLMRLPNASMIFNIAFVVVLISLLVQGWTLGLAARALGIALPHREREVRRVEVDLPGSLERELVGYPVANDAAVLSGTEVPSWAQLAMVVRNGEILMPEAAGPIAAGDYAYFLADPKRLQRLNWLFAAPEEAREAERELFGEFTFASDVPLADIASFYDLPIRPQDAPLTLAQHFDRAYEHTVEVGDRVRLGPITLVARTLSDAGVDKVGIKFAGVTGALAQRAQRRRWRLAAWLARHLPTRD